MVRLVSLLGAATAQRSTWIELEEVLAERRSSPLPSSTPVLATVEFRAKALVESDPRVLLDLLEFAVATVVRAGVASPRIVADRTSDDLLLITVEASPADNAPRSREAPSSARMGSARGAKAQPTSEPPPSRILDVSLHPELPREVDVVRLAARSAGFDLAIGPDARSVTLTERPAKAQKTMGASA
jgi:hypothetical protein